MIGINLLSHLNATEIVLRHLIIYFYFECVVSGALYITFLDLTFGFMFTCIIFFNFFFCILIIFFFLLLFR